LHVAATAQAARGLERVLFLPAAQPPHKPEQILASGADRLAMLELALHGHRDWVADGLELDRPGPSYTIDTVRQLRGRLGLHADARLFLLLGSDNLRGFAQWKDIGELLELSEPVIVARERDLRPALESLQRESSPALAARLGLALVACAPFEASSSAIRERLSRGEIPRDVLPERVAEYITLRGIYGARKRLPPPPG
jgi:nicotinate-nucleotide adenylyltransferase